MQEYDGDTIDGGRSFLSSIPIWLIAIIGAGFLVIIMACAALFLFTVARGGSAEIPTLLPTVIVPTEAVEPTLPPRVQTLTAVAEVALSPSPSPTGAAGQGTVSATALPVTPQATATLAATRPPIPTNTRRPPPPPPPVILPTVTIPPPATPTTAPSSAWLGEYYANRDLSGAPAFTRPDNGTSINFNWGTGSPSGLPADNFSIRWTRTYYFTAGTYRFNAFSDDGVRVYLDNQLIINEWHDASNITYSVDLTLAAGNHALKVEYYEHVGAAQIQFWWEGSTTFPAWRGEYYANQTLSGTPAIVRNDNDINFNWGNGSPASGIPADHFSARWTRTLGFNAGTYRFNVRSDDGVRVWVDNELIIDQWRDATNVTFSAERTLSGGTHALKVEYYENTGTAQIQFWWELSGAYPEWKGEYFANATLTGGPTVVKNDANIDFNWGTGPPIQNAGLPADNFSVRWTRSLPFNQGTHRFHILVDDGARLYVDGQLIINEWRDGVAREVTADIELAAGDHLVRLEYYDHIDQARIRLWWDNLGTTFFPNWKGEYFTNAGLSGDPTLVRNDLAIDFDWGSGSPAPGIPVDNFSVRWTRRSQWQAGTYRLYIQVNDGVRLFVDGVPVLNEWHANAGTSPYVVVLPFTAGTHTVVMEYYEGTGNALARFWRERITN